MADARCPACNRWLARYTPVEGTDIAIRCHGCKATVQIGAARARLIPEEVLRADSTRGNVAPTEAQT